jgi:hypothetical protein
MYVLVEQHISYHLSKNSNQFALAYRKYYIDKNTEKFYQKSICVVNGRHFSSFMSYIFEKIKGKILKFLVQMNLS